MNVKRKTVRFQDNASDLAVYEAISDYKSYGFRSESHMGVEAVKQFIHKDGSAIDSEELADLIVQKLSGKITLSEVATDTADAPTSEAAFDAALNFLEGL